MTDKYQEKARELFKEYYETPIRDVNDFTRIVSQALRDAAKVEWPTPQELEISSKEFCNHVPSVDKLSYEAGFIGCIAWLRSKVEGM
jgi:hypothetical protein